MGSFKDKVAVITGAASGIGRALAQELGRRGAQVVLLDLQAAAAESVAEGIRKAGGKASAQLLDVRDAAAVKAALEGIAAREGRIDLLFNNAGVAVNGEVRDLTLDDWRFQLDVNLNGVIHGVIAGYPIMLKQGFGHIVNTASVAGLCPSPGLTPYATTKHAVVGLSVSLRAEAEALGVKVSAVCPGFIETAIIHGSRFVGVDKEKTLAALPVKPLDADQCALVILRGVEKNRPLIVVTGHAWLYWLVQRLSPRLAIAFATLATKKLRAARTA